MQKFIEIPATKRSLSKRNLVFGIGINDAEYIVNPKVNGKRIYCPFYRVWINMLMRCYSSKYHGRQSSYKNASVSPEWLMFSNFKLWMIEQDWQGNELDKDLLIKDNEHYSAKTCCFISKKLNTLLTNTKHKDRKNVLGVSWHKATKKYIVKCSENNIEQYLGVFSTEKEAHETYCAYKANIIINFAEQQKDSQIKDRLYFLAANIHLEG